MATGTVPGVSALDVLRTTAPRLLRDSLGPVAAFYVGYRIRGLVAGIFLSALVGFSLYVLERRRGRSGLIARLALGYVLVQATVGLLSRSVTLYFLQPVLLDLLLASVFIGSAAMGRPITGSTARDAYAFPPEVVESATFGRVFGRLSLVWGGYFLLSAAVRSVALSTRHVETILLVNALSGAPIVIAMMVFSVWYSVRGFRASAEWGPALATLEQAPAPPAGLEG